jgi:hypothetical protein
VNIASGVQNATIMSKLKSVETMDTPKEVYSSVKDEVFIDQLRDVVIVFCLTVHILPTSASSPRIFTCNLSPPAAVESVHCVHF